MSNSLAVQRLMREKQKMEADPNPHFIAIPSEQNLFEWHFVLFNFADDSPFKSGQYHGIINIPVEYPLKPPSLLFQTPSARFKVGEKICLSFTNYHPETWSTSWTIASMLIGLISFMHTDERTVGGVDSHSSQKRIFAQKSIQHNLANPKFVTLFSPYFDRLGIQQNQINVETQPAEENPQTVLLPRQQRQNNYKKVALFLGIAALAIVIVIIIVI